MSRATGYATSAIERLSLLALLRVYPPAFRIAFGAEVLATYGAARRDCPTTLGRLRLWGRTLVSLFNNGVAERAHLPAWRRDYSVLSNRQGVSLMSRVVRALASIPQDFRLGLRLLFKQPGFTVLAVLILSLGIGANTAVFGLANTLLLKPRVGAGDTLVGIYSQDRTEPTLYRAFSFPDYEDLSARTEVFDSLAAHNVVFAGFTEGDVTRRSFVDVVTRNYFDTFGVSLALGRTFTAEEERPGADLPAAVISYASWQRLGGHDDVLGRRMRLNQRDYTVVGVAPKGFLGSTVLMATEVWVPMGVYDTLAGTFSRQDRTTTLSDRSQRGLMVIAHLKPGMTPASVAPVLEGISEQMEQAYPVENKNQVLVASPLSRVSISTEPSSDSALVTVSMVLLLMAGIVLFIASLNLANMLLARGGARRKEFAIRLALGGGRLRIVRQLLMESFVLSLAGGLGGLVIGMAALRGLTASILPAIPVQVMFDTTPDARLFLATFGFCLLSTLFFGLGPAWKLAKTDALPELKDYAGELPAGRRSRFGLAGRDVLVMVQLALSLVLLTSAGLIVLEAINAAKADPGFSLDAGIVANIDSSLAGDDEARGRQVYSDALAAVRRQPGVTAASISTLMPFGEFTVVKSVQLPGAPISPSDPDAKSKRVATIYTSITADYFQSLGLTMRRGREFRSAEAFATEGPRIAIVDEALARDLFGNGDAMGRQVQVESDTEGVAPLVYDIVGIAPPIRHQLFDQTPGAHLYVPLGRQFGSNAYLQIRTTAGSAEAEEAMLPGIRRALLGVDSRLPILTLETRPMFRAHGIILAMLTAGAGIFIVFGVVALVMAVLGVYGVKAYIVSRRTREIGIRVALGAAKRDVIWMVIREGLTLSAVGLGIGLVLSVLVGVSLAGVFPHGGGRNGVVIAGAALTLAASALVASWWPARRATRIAPVRALRAE
jgi:predicted permease